MCVELVCLQHYICLRWAWCVWC